MTALVTTKVTRGFPKKLFRIVATAPVTQPWAAGSERRPILIGNRFGIPVDISIADGRDWTPKTEVVFSRSCSQ